MRKVAAGLVFGLILGSSAAAFAAHICGDEGKLRGWTVTQDGIEVCSNPEVDRGQHEIQCN